MTLPCAINSSRVRKYVMLAILAAYVLLVIANGVRTFALRPASAVLWFLWLRLGFSAFTALLFLAVGALAWLYARQRTVARIFFGFCCSVSLVFVGETSATAPRGDLFFELTSGLGGAVGMYLLAMLLLVFPHNYLARRPARIRPVWLYVIFLTVVLIIEIVSNLLPLSIVSPVSPLLHISVATLLCGVLATLLLTYRKASDDRERQQLRFLTWGGMLALTPFIGLTLLPGAESASASLDPQISTATMGLFPLALGYAVLRYQILVLDRFMRRTATWIVGTIMVVVFNYCAILLFSFVLTGPAYALCVAATSTLLLAILPRIADRVTQRLFFFNEFGSALPRMSDTDWMLQETNLDLESVADQLSLAFMDTLGIPAVAVFIRVGDEKQSHFALVPALEPSSLRYNARSDLLQQLVNAMRDASAAPSPTIQPAQSADPWTQIRGERLLEQLAAANHSLFLSELSQERCSGTGKGLSHFFSEGRSTNAEPLLLPLRSQGIVIGLLALGQRHEPYAGPHFEIIRMLLARFAPVLENCVLYARALQMESLAATDPLTQLPNHRSLIERLESEIARASRTGHPLSLLFFDGDHFKRVNDTYGHAVGDAVLRELAARARSVLRAGDLLGRYGGEEFAAILPETGAAEVLVIAERVRSAVAGSPLVVGLVEGGHPTTISVGISTFPADGATGHELLEAADQAMYWSKRLGRNQVRTPAEARRAMHNAALAATISELERRDDPALDGLSPEQLLRADQASLVFALMRLLDLRDPDIVTHSYQVSDLSAAIAREMRLSEQAVVDVASAALLHDIGKIGVPDALLRKAGPLSPTEWEIIRHHPEQGASLLEDSPALSHLARAVRCHHERLDGSGYPNQLLGDAIPLDARIIAVSEAYHAMISDRPYQTARSEAEAKAELERCCDTLFDAAVVSALQTILERQKSANATTLPV